jgi:hypothetical protein
LHDVPQDCPKLAAKDKVFIAEIGRIGSLKGLQDSVPRVMVVLQSGCGDGFRNAMDIEREVEDYSQRLAYMKWALGC